MQTSVRPRPVAAVILHVVVVVVIADCGRQPAAAAASPSAEAPAAWPAALRQRHQVEYGQAADRSDQGANIIQAGYVRPAEHHQGAVHAVPS